MHEDPKAGSLLARTGQAKKLNNVGLVFVLAMGALYLLSRYASALPVSMAWLLCVGVVLAVVAGASAFRALSSVRCPKCRLAWVRWSISHQPHNRWFIWLQTFQECPGCGYQGEAPASQPELKPEPEAAPIRREVLDYGLQVECQRHVDASERNEWGFYDYYYEYDIYRFNDTPGGASLAARSYTDTPGRASFIGLEPGAGRPSRGLGDADLQSPLFRAACAYLRTRGKTDLQWLSGRGKGYEVVPPP